MHDDTQTVVIGAGLAGLSAAHHLNQVGIKAVVLEAGTGPGGRVQTTAKDGYLFDRGADALTDSYTQYFKLLKAVGLADQITPLPSLIGVVRNGRVVYVDMASKWSLATSGFLSPLAKLRLLFGLKKVVPLWNGHQIAHMHRLSPLDDRQHDAAHHSRSVFGREASEYLIDPLVRTLGGTGLKGSSWAEVISGLGMANGAAYCLKGGQAALPTALAAKADVRYGCRVSAISEQSHGVSVAYQDADGHNRSLTAQGCVLATMYEDGCRIYPKLGELSVEYGRSHQYMKLGKVQLAYGAPTLTKAYAIQVPTVEDQSVMLIFLDHNKCRDRAPPGHSLVSVYSETKAAAEYLTRSDEELTEWARSYAERWFPELSGKFVTSLVTRWPTMAPAGVPGQYARAAELLPRMPAEGARVQIACDMFSKTSQESAVTWGTDAASRLARLLRPH